MLHLAEETKLFDFLSSVNFRAGSFSVGIKFNFIERMTEILSFPREFSYQNVDYVKLANINICPSG